MTVAELIDELLKLDCPSATVYRADEENFCLEVKTVSKEERILRTRTRGEYKYDGVHID